MTLFGGIVAPSCMGTVYLPEALKTYPPSPGWVAPKFGPSEESIPAGEEPWVGKERRCPAPQVELIPKIRTSDPTGLRVSWEASGLVYAGLKYTTVSGVQK